MTKAELEKQLEEKQKIIDKHKARIKAQNESAKERWDTVSCRLPAGTKDRIKALGLTVNGVINDSVLAFLECAEESAEEPPQEPIQTIQNAEIKYKKAKSEKPTNEPHKSKIKANTTSHQDKKKEEADFSENNPVKAGFDWVKSCEWNEEEHGRVVPHPPVGAPKNAIWDSCTGEWYEPLPF